MRRNPLENALSLVGMRSADPREWLHESLDRLEDLLEKPGSDLMKSLMIYTGWGMETFRPEDVPRAEALYQRVLERGGAGQKAVQEGLLYHLAVTGDPRSLPFWERMLQLRLKRDLSRRFRQQMVVAGLATLAHDDPKHRPALERLVREAAEPIVRADALRALYLPSLLAERPIDAAFLALLGQRAVAEPDVLPRHQARRGLKLAGAEVPLDLPGGASVFRAWVSGHERAFSCVIEVQSEQSLHDLHLAIQAGFEWDNDHLYVFSLTPGFDEDAWTIPGLDPLGEPLAEFFEESGSNAGEWRIGELGLVEGARLHYLFDLGDRHTFDLAVVERRPQAGQARFPRVVQRSGEPPAQYLYEEDLFEEE